MREGISGQLDLFSSAASEDSYGVKIKYPDVPEFSLREKLKLEKESSGMYFSGHILDTYSEHIATLGVDSLAEMLAEDRPEEYVRNDVKVAVIVSDITVKTTRNNEKMAFVNVQDKFGEIECIVFPKTYVKYQHLVRVDAALLIKGSIVFKDDGIRLHAGVITELIENSRFVPQEKTAGNANRPQATKIKTGGENNPEGDTVLSRTTVTEESARQYSKLFLRVPDLFGEKYRKALNIVEIFEGYIPVFFYDSSGKKYHAFQKGVNLTPSVLRELENIIGKENVVPK
jgi:DNA polymerase-3 subunit alpha